MPLKNEFLGLNLSQTLLQNTKEREKEVKGKEKSYEMQAREDRSILHLSISNSKRWEEKVEERQYLKIVYLRIHRRTRFPRHRASRWKEPLSANRDKLKTKCLKHVKEKSWVRRIHQKASKLSEKRERIIHKRDNKLTALTLIPGEICLYQPKRFERQNKGEWERVQVLLFGEKLPMLGKHV